LGGETIPLAGEFRYAAVASFRLEKKNEEDWMEKKIIIGFQISNRVKNVQRVQTVLTEYGCFIKTRIGLHDVGENFCSGNGLVLLETFGDETRIAELEAALKAVEGLQLQKMEFPR
jgi:hypothetical protein